MDLIIHRTKSMSVNGKLPAKDRDAHDKFYEENGSVSEHAPIYI